MKFNLSLLPVDGGPFNCRPAHDVELEDEKILCNNVVFPHEFNPHNVRLFVIGNEFGAIAALWGCEHEILDDACDAGLMDSFAVSSEDYAKYDEAEREDCTLLGNASEPFDLTNAWMQAVRLDPAKDFALYLRFAEARGQASTSLFF